MDHIIIIRATDPDGKLFESIKKMLDSAKTEIVDFASEDDYILSFPGLTINIRSGEVFRDGIPVYLNCGEFSVLCYLAQRPNRIFTRDQLYQAVYGEDCFSSNTVSSIICRLRRKLEADPRDPTYIKTKVGLGYKFEIPKK